LAAYLRGSAIGENDDGFIPRFQLAVYPDTDNPFVLVDRWPNKEAKDRTMDVFRFLTHLSGESVGAEKDEMTPDGIPYLRFDEDAQQFFYTWWTALEVKIRGEQDSECLRSHLAKYRSLMPSLALIFHLVEVANGRESGPVPLREAQRAAVWCEYLEEHAKRIYQAAFDGDPEPAKLLAKRLKTLPNPFTIRQVVQKGWKCLDTTDSGERAVAMLEDHGWVVRMEVPPGPKGGRPQVLYYINPDIPQEPDKEGQS